MKYDQEHIAVLRELRRWVRFFGVLTIGAPALGVGAGLAYVTGGRL